MALRKRKRERLDPESLKNVAEESLQRTAENQSRVDYVNFWLKLRLEQNGFGQDFEYTLRPKGAK